MDSSRDLQPIHAKSFINRLHLVLYAYVKIFDVMFFFAFTGFTVKNLKQGLRYSDPERHKYMPGVEIMNYECFFI